MLHGKIRFNSPDDVVDFVRTVSKFSTDIDVKQRTAILDGKSLEGLMALQLQTDLDCVLHGDLSECEDLVKSIHKYTVSGFEEE